MFRKIADNRDAQSLAVQFRRKRFAFFLSLLSQVERPVHILDIGGTENYWKTMGLDADDEVFITLLNLTEDRITLPRMTSIVGDARKIQVDISGSGADGKGGVPDRKTIFYSNAQQVFPHRASFSVSVLPVPAIKNSDLVVAAFQTGLVYKNTRHAPGTGDR
jgi:hypothetical protein